MSAMRLTNKALTAAAAEAAALWLDTLPDPAACSHRFSEAFERKMTPLFQSARRREKRIAFVRSAAAALAALLIGFAAWIAVDTNARAAVVNWVWEVYEHSVIYRFVGSGEDAAFPAWRLTKLPEGYSEAERYEDESGTMILYFNPRTRDSIVFDCRILAPDAALTLGNLGDGAVREQAEVWGRAADFYSVSGSGSCLVWRNGEETVLFSLNGTLEKSTMIELAESVVPAEPGK